MPTRYPAPRRLIAIGDVHGDLAATRRALQIAKVIDSADRWIGADTFVVQTGDVLDRGDDEQAILDLFERLEAQATAAGGRFVWLLGNHEIMNGAGDFRYVTPGGMSDFDDVPNLPPVPAGVEPSAKARAAAFLPGGPYARVLAGQNTVVIVGDTVLSHAGPIGRWARPDVLEKINAETRCYLSTSPPGNTLPTALTNDDSPVWTREYGKDHVDCTMVAAALTALGAKRMVVAHTPQPTGITHACDQTLWRIDTGMAKAYGGSAQVLEIVEGGPPRVLR